MGSGGGLQPDAFAPPAFAGRADVLPDVSVAGRVLPHDNDRRLPGQSGYGAGCAVFCGGSVYGESVVPGHEKAW